MSRRLDLSKFRGGSDSEEEEGAFSARKKPPIQLDTLKQETFSHGVRKKTKKEIEKENEERKRIEEEKAAAIALAEFDEAFNGDGAEAAPRGGMGGNRFGGGYPPRGPRSMGAGAGFVRAGGDTTSAAYQPPRHIPTGLSRPAMSSNFRSPSPEPSKPKPKGKRVMDSFLEEIKREQKTREEKFGQVAKKEGSSVSAMAAWEKARGSHDFGDPETTNLFVSNLPSAISEESLGMFFAKYGPVGAVKIMWPRGDEDAAFGAHMAAPRRPKAGLSGFVAYMKRSDAERAVKELDGFDWGGCVLRVGWSKMIRPPVRAIYQLPNVREDRDRSRSPKRRRRSRSRTPPRDKDTRRSSRNDSRPHPSDRNGSARRSASPRDSRDRGRRRSTGRHSDTSSSWSGSSRSRSPAPRAKRSRHDVILDKMLDKIGREKEKFIAAVAQKVRDHGAKFEDVLRDREAKNEKFAFLRNKDLPEYHFYQLCLDSRYRLPTPPPDAFTDDGKAELYSSDSAEDSERERTRKGTLGKNARRRFESGLRAMTGTREEIARLMEFAMVHADAAEEVSEIVCQSLMLEATPVPRKLARLHLISDILHNSASPLPNVWRYRQALEARLPPVMEHLADLHRSLVAYAGRLSGESFKSQVVFVLEIWENWIVFTPQVTEVMRSILNGRTADQSEPNAKLAVEQATVESQTEGSTPAMSSKFKTGGFKKAFVPVDTAHASQQLVVAPAATNLEDASANVENDLDGEAMDLDDDIDGVAIAADDIDGVAMGDNDIDGVSMEDEDLDGVAMVDDEDDLDGVAIVE